MRTVTTSIALATLLLPAVASARQWDLSAGSSTTFVRSPSFDATSDSDAFTQGDFALAVEVVDDVPVLDTLWAELRLSTGSTSAIDFDLYEAGLDLTTWQVGARATRDIYPRLRLFAHADLGLTHGTLDIGRINGSTVLRDRDWATSLSAGVGVDLAAFRARADAPAPGFALGLRLELGYVATADLDFAAHPVGDGSDAPQLDVVATSLGSVDTGGAVVRIGLFGRF